MRSGYDAYNTCGLSITYIQKSEYTSIYAMSGEHTGNTLIGNNGT